MYALGHYGVALLVYAPVGFLLVRTDPTLALLGLVGALSLSTLPDCDLRFPFVSHRGITHTVPFILAVSGLLAWAGWLLGRGPYAPIGGPVESAAFGFGIGLLGLGSHILGDVLTPAGVAVLWPLSGFEYTVGVTRADNRVANWGLFGLGVIATAASLWLAVRV